MRVAVTRALTLFALMIVLLSAASDGPPVLGSAGARWENGRVWAAQACSATDDEGWRSLSEEGAPTARRQHTAVWTGSEMMVWGGRRSGSLGDGGRYDPRTDSWRMLSTLNAPSRRADHTAIWTGSEMIVWGGTESAGVAGGLGDGGRYDPATDTWTELSETDAPFARWNHRAIWTGTEMIVWGGQSSAGGWTYTGGRYDPAIDVWIPLPPLPDGIVGDAAVWTGSELVIWGGSSSGPRVPGVGARWSPSSNTWSPMSTDAAPNNADQALATWTGSEMIVWGGRVGNSPVTGGGVYDPVPDVWTPLAGEGAPRRRGDARGVWTGREWVIWGGYGPTPTGRNSPIPIGDGAAYNAADGHWRSLPSAPIPDRRLHSAVWTGTEMIVWGGLVHDPAYRAPDATIHSSDGAAYKPGC
jgi:hypothetical protein